jgi:SAM-dependent methyltransferase
MKESDIRPDGVLEKYQEAHARDIKKMKEYTFVEVSCPACGLRKCETKFEKFNTQFLECSECDTIYISPRPIPDDLRRFYKESESLACFNDIYDESRENRRILIHQPRAERVLSNIRFGESKIVEVGSGDGVFIEEMLKLGDFEYIAIEPNKARTENYPDGVVVINDTVENADIKSADVIISFELIEHLFDPRELIAAMYRILKPGGIIILTTPNAKGFELSVLGKEADNFTLPGHLNYYNPKSLAILLESIGFEIMEVETPGKLDVDLVRKGFLENKINKDEHEFIHYMVTQCPEELQEFLSENKLSSHMWLVAKKA